jgi:hypothetical protein
MVRLTGLSKRLRIAIAYVVYVPLAIHLVSVGGARVKMERKGGCELT